MNKVKVVKKAKPSLTVKLDKYEKAERNLVHYMLRSPEVIKIYNNQITYMPTKEYRLLAREINMFYKENGFISEADLIDYVECDEDILNTIKKINAAALPETYSLQEIEDYAKVIKDYNIKNETARLTKKI